MNVSTQVSKPKSSQLLAITVGIAVILFCVTGIAAIMGWIPTSIGGTRDVTTVSSTEKPVKKSAQPADAKAKTAPAPAPVANNSVAARKCSECGVIESVRETATSGEGSGLGAAGGAVVGGLLGHQVGGGRGQDIATVVGAVGGAVAGNEVEKRVKSTKGYDITVRLEDGSTRVIREANPPSWRAGDRVRILEGAIRAL